MNETKAWYLSKTVWGSALVAIAFVLNFFNVQLTPTEQAELAEAGPDAILAVMQFVGLILAIIGRFTAKEKLTS
jgi:hypothetical protein